MSSSTTTGDVQDGLNADDPDDDEIDHVPDNMAPHFAGAYRKGARAFRDGDDKRRDDPYAEGGFDQNGSCFGTTWDRAYSNAWRLGFENEKRAQSNDSPRSYRPRSGKLGR